MKVDPGTWRGLFTVVMFVLFVAICVWAWSGRRKKTYDAAARMPLEPDELEKLDGDTDR